MANKRLPDWPSDSEMATMAETARQYGEKLAGLSEDFPGEYRLGNDSCISPLRGHMRISPEGEATHFLDEGTPEDDDE
jgi:hypothetical protein